VAGLAVLAVSLLVRLSFRLDTPIVVIGAVIALTTVGGAILQTMQLQTKAVPAEGIGEDHVGPRLRVAALDPEDPVRVVEIPGLAAVPRLEARVLELRAHGAVAEQNAALEGFEQ